MSSVIYISSRLSKRVPFEIVEVIFVLEVSFVFMRVARLAITDLPFNLELSNFLSASSVSKSLMYSQKHELELVSLVSSINERNSLI